jgi:hypothetical protein
VRSRRASAATARAFSLVIHADVPPEHAARILAESSSPSALSEAIAYLQPALFGEDDRVVVAATDLLVRALTASAAQLPRPWPMSPSSVVRAA